MVLQKCTECGGNVSSTAKACPHCGAEPPKASVISSAKPVIPQKKKRRIWPWILGAFVVLAIFAGYRDLTPAELAAREQHKAERATEKVKEEQAAREQHKAERATEKVKKEQENTAKKAARDNEVKEIVWVEKGKDAVKARLKDSDSAQFKDVYFFRGKDNIPMTCGQVNSKNSFGGFAGFQHFVSGGSSELTFLETEVEDFAKVWNRLCTK